MKMKMELQLSDNTKLEIDEWNNNIDLKIYAKPMKEGEWRFVNGVVLPNDVARMLAITLLNKTGNACDLLKKNRWE